MPPSTISSSGFLPAMREILSKAKKLQTKYPELIELRSIGSAEAPAFFDMLFSSDQDLIARLTAQYDTETAVSLHNYQVAPADVQTAWEDFLEFSCEVLKLMPWPKTS